MQTAGFIERSIANMKKLSSRPSLAVLVKRRDLIQQYWGTFQTCHFDIMRISGAKNSNYYTLGQFEVTEGGYIEQLATI